MISIVIQDYSKDERILYIRNDTKNIWGLLSIMQFEDELELCGIDIKRVKNNGEIGYVFNKSVDEDLVYEETKRFIYVHGLENQETF